MCVCVCVCVCVRDFFLNVKTFIVVLLFEMQKAELIICYQTVSNCSLSLSTHFCNLSQVIKKNVNTSMVVRLFANCSTSLHISAAIFHQLKAISTYA